jgi:DNA polymerase-3 subunit epsilon
MQLASLDESANDLIASVLRDAEHESHQPLSGMAVAIWRHPELEQVKQLVAAAQAHLAELESEYTRERHAVEVTQGRLFNLLKIDYLRRDHLRLAVEFRRKYLDALLQEGEEGADAVFNDYQRSRRQTDKEYEQAEIEMGGRKSLSEVEEQELNALWKKLVRLYHPDRFMNDPTKAEAFQRLTAEINRARDAGDIATLREIAVDPNGYMLRNNMGVLDFDDADSFSTHRKLFDSLQMRIVEMIEALDSLRADPAYELHRLTYANPDQLRVVAEECAGQLARESATLAAEAEKLDEQIIELAGNLPFDQFKHQTT